MEFKFPDVGEGIHEGVIVTWLKEIGEEVDEDEPIVEVETDKAVVEIPSPAKGKIKKRYHEVGDTVNVGEVLVEFEVEGQAQKEVEQNEEDKEETQEADSTGVVGALEDADSIQEEKLDLSSQTTNKEENSNAIKALPFVRKFAEELNIDLNTIKPSGKNGEITIEDVKAKLQIHTQSQPKQTSTTKFSTPEYGKETKEKLTPIRKAIATNMTASLSHTAQLTHFDEVIFDNTIKKREADKPESESKGIKLSFLPYIIEAIKLALKDFPTFNASFDEQNEEIVIKDYINLGVAVDTDAGLMVPVIKNIENLDKYEIAKQINDLAERARIRKLKPEEMRDSTITITNYGSIGGTFATPILNYPNLVNIGIGRSYSKLVLEDGKPKEITILPISLTYDHQIIDGANAARFTNKLKEILELKS